MPLKVPGLQGKHSDVYATPERKEKQSDSEAEGSRCSGCSSSSQMLLGHPWHEAQRAAVNHPGSWEQKRRKQLQSAQH